MANGISKQIDDLFIDETPLPAENGDVSSQIDALFGDETVTPEPQFVNIGGAVTALEGEPAPAFGATTQPPEEEGQSAISEAVSNIPKSGLDFLRNIFTAVTSPVQTAKAVGKIGAGAIEKGVAQVIPGFEGVVGQKDFEAFVDLMQKRFGGLDEIEETFRKDPVGLLADVSTVLGVGGAALTKVGQVSKVAGLTKAGAIASKAATPVGTLLKSRAPINSLIKTALNLSKTKGLKRIDELANAFLKKGLNINRKSLTKLDNNIKTIRKEINNIIDTKTVDGIKIKTDDIVKSLDDLIENSAKQGLEIPDLAVIKKMRDQFAQQNGSILTPRQVQDIKVGFNKGFKPDLESRFGQVRAKVRDTLRKSTKEELEKLHPQLKTLNAKEGVSIELSKAIEDAIIALEKRPTVGAKGLAAGGIAGVTGAAGADAATGVRFAVSAIVVEKILSNPKIQVLLAKALNRVNVGLAKSGKLTTTAFQAGRVERLQPEEP